MILRWLAPLGLLGACGIVVLLILYLIKPQYKKQTVSGTMLWKRVLARRRRGFPVLNHILLFLLQTLLIVLMALILAQPYLFSEDILLEDSEYVIILDASASMRAREAGSDTAKTRFQRAVEEAEKTVNELLGTRDGAVSVILADATPDYLVNGAGRDRRDEIHAAFLSASCTTEEADLEGALRLARAQLDANPSAKVFLYTDTEFGDMGTALTVVNLADPETEWNVAILGCNVAIRDNEYRYDIRLGAYGNAAVRANIRMEIRGADNGRGPNDYTLNIPVFFEVDPNSPSYQSVRTVSVCATDAEYGGGENWFYETFDEVYLELENIEDSIADDNVFYVYGGARDSIKVQYWSNEPNIFWQIGFTSLANNLSSKRVIDFRQVYTDAEEVAATSGYDIYIFEHGIPDEVLLSGLPQDGVVILADPDRGAVSRANLDFRIGDAKSPAEDRTGCTSPADHPIFRYNDPSSIHLTEYKQLALSDNSFLVPVLYCDGDPVLLVERNATRQMVVMPFSINMSDFYGRTFMTFLYDLLDYFLPVTLPAYDFTVGDSVTLSCKGVSMDVEGGSAAYLDTFPAEYTFLQAGTYTFTTHFGLRKEDEVRKAYVHILTDESSIFEESDFRLVLDNRELTGEAGRDLLVWLAAASLLILLVEWYLQFKDIV